MPNIEDFQLLAQLIKAMNNSAADLDKAVLSKNKSAIKKSKAAIMSLQFQIKSSISKLKQIR